EVAEGVDASALVGAASLYRLDGSSNWLPGPVSFAPEPVSAGATWGGVVRAWGRADNWDGWSGSIAQLGVPPGLLGAGSNASGSLAAEFPFVAVPPPAAWHGFDGDTTEVASWGDVTWLGGKAGYDSRCEEGGCVQLGPFVPYGCGADRIGIAGRLQLPLTAT